MIRGSSNVDAVLARLQVQAQRLSDLSVPLQQSGVIVRDAAVTRIKEQGGDQSWIPNKRGGHTGIDTGRMMGSIQVSSSSSDSVTVGTNVPYARYFQEGTGVFAGHSPWTIVPKNGKGLAFSIGGETFVRKSITIPGQPARPFLLIEDAQRQQIVAAFERWINGASS